MLVLLGCGKWQKKIIETAHAMGIKVLGMDGSPLASSANLVDLFIIVDITDPVACVNALRGHAADIEGCITTTDSCQRSVGLINSEYHLHGITYDQALLTTDKLAMKSIFWKLGVSVPSLSNVGVRKPIWDSSSRGVVLSGSHENGTFTESQIHGMEHTVEGFVDETGMLRIYAVSDKFKVDDFSVSTDIKFPSLTMSDTDAWDMLQSFVSELKLMSCPIHAEVMESPEGGLYVIEIATRTASGIGTHILNWLTNGDYLACLINQAMGEKCALWITATERAALFHFYTPTGHLISFTPPENAAYWDFDCKLNGLYFLPTTDAERAGWAIYLASSQEELIEQTGEIDDAIKTSTDHR